MEAMTTGLLFKAISGSPARASDWCFRFGASMLGVAALALPTDRATVARALVDAGDAVGIDLTDPVHAVVAWLAVNPGVTTVGYLMATISALVLVGKRPWHDIAGGTLCATRASAALVLFFGVAAESGAGVHLTPTLVIVAILVVGTVHATRSERGQFDSSFVTLSLMFVEVMFAVFFAPVVVVCVLYAAMFGPFSAHERHRHAD